MAEYYGYAERAANAYVDWASLGKNLTETVQGAYALREQKKKQLDEVMQKNYDELANAPSGLNQDINSTISSHVGNTKQFLLNANKLLKAGILNPEDYTLIMQNQKEDTKAIFANAKGWQDAWAKIQDDVINKNGSQAMLDVASDVASFGKFKDMDFMINPVTGRVSASKMITGPNGEKVKGQSLSMQQLNVLMNQNINKYDLTGKLVAAEKVIGDFTDSVLVRGAIQKQGSITNVTDKAIKDTFDKAKNTFIKEVMANPFNAMSILRDHAGADPKTNTPYKISTNPADKGKDGVILYVDPDGDGSYEPQLTDEQKKVAEQFAVDQFVGMIDRKVEKSAVNAITPYTPPEYALLRGDKAKEKEMAVGAWDALRFGDAKQKQDAAETLLGTKAAKEDGLLDIDLDSKPGYVTLKYVKREGEPSRDRTIKISDNGAEWSAIGVEIHGEEDAERAKKAAGNTWKNPSKFAESDVKGVRAFREGEKAVAKVEKIADDAYVTDISEDDTDQTIKNIQAKLPEGFTAEQAANWDDDIRITYTLPSGEKITSEWFPINNAAEAAEASKGIAAYINDKLSTVATPAKSTQTPGSSAAASGGRAR